MMEKTDDYCIADWEVQPSTSRIKHADQIIQLEPRIMDVLEYLAAKHGQVVSREELEAEVWKGRVVSYDVVTNAIVKLRKAFADDSRNPWLIETLPKKGYRLLAPVNSIKDTTFGAKTLNSNHSAQLIENRTRRVRRSIALFIVLSAVLVTAGYFLLRIDPVSGLTATQPLPSIAVLPFQNMNNNTDEDYFADGVTDDLITGLARHSSLLVIARDSSFVYKNRDLDIKEIAEKLNVQYILRGSLRNQSNYIIINAQLVDVSTGGYIWAEQYEGETGDVFKIQQKVTSNIISSLISTIKTEELKSIDEPFTDSQQAYEYFLYGKHSFYQYLNRNENLKAREYFQKAVNIDNQFAMAYAMIAWTHVFDVMNGWSDNRAQSLADAISISKKSVSLQEALPLAYFVSGLAYREQREYVKALVEAEKAIKYDPNYANAHVLLATLLYYAGRPKEGLERIKRAMQINPHHPYNYTFHLGQAYYILGQYNDSIEAFLKGLDSNPASERLHVWLAAAYAKSGDMEDAAWEKELILVENPDFKLSRIEKSFPFKNPEDREHFMDGLRLAGFSDQ